MIIVISSVSDIQLTIHRTFNSQLGWQHEQWRQWGAGEWLDIFVDWELLLLEGTLSSNVSYAPEETVCQLCSFYFYTLTGISTSVIPVKSCSRYLQLSSVWTSESIHVRWHQCLLSRWHIVKYLMTLANIYNGLKIIDSTGSYLSAITPYQS